jgi:heme-degrading monooxygenase HmoA
MIVELAQITVAPGDETAFEAAFANGIQWAAGSPGYLRHELGRSIENPNRYVLRIEWATLEDHTMRFRGSAAFAQWRAAVGPYFSIPPEVEHFLPVGGARLD